MPAYTGVPWILVGERGHHSWAGVVEARTGRVRGLPLSASGYSPLARRCKVHAREACLATGFAAGSPPPKARLWDWARTGTAKRGNSLGPEYCGLARNVLRLPIAKSNSLYILVNLGLTSRTSEQQQQPSLFAVVPRHLVTSVHVQTYERVPRCASAPKKTNKVQEAPLLKNMCLD